MKLSILQVSVPSEILAQRAPFHRFNLVRYEDREHLKTLSPYALVMPFTAEIKALYAPMSLPAYRQPHDAKAAVTTSPAPVLATLKPDDWILHLPLLQVDRKKIRYLLSRKYGVLRKPRNAQVLPGPTAPRFAWPELTYLQTPTRTVRPVCLICPRILEHKSGLCNLGDAVCNKELLSRCGMESPS